MPTSLWATLRAACRLSKFVPDEFVEPGSNPNPVLHKQKMGHIGPFLIWRRARDSNPRRFNPQRFSRPPLSTTQPALRNFHFVLCFSTNIHVYISRKRRCPPLCSGLPALRPYENHPRFSPFGLACRRFKFVPNEFVGPAYQLSNFAPGKIVDHSASSPKFETFLNFATLMGAMFEGTGAYRKPRLVSSPNRPQLTDIRQG